MCLKPTACGPGSRPPQRVAARTSALIMRASVWGRLSSLPPDDRLESLFHTGGAFVTNGAPHVTSGLQRARRGAYHRAREARAPHPHRHRRLDGDRALLRVAGVSESGAALQAAARGRAAGQSRLLLLVGTLDAGRDLARAAFPDSVKALETLARSPHPRESPADGGADRDRRVDPLDLQQSALSNGRFCEQSADRVSHQLPRQPADVLADPRRLPRRRLLPQRDAAGVAALARATRRAEDAAQSALSLQHAQLDLVADVHRRRRGGRIDRDPRAARRGVSARHRAQRWRTGDPACPGRQDCRSPTRGARRHRPRQHARAPQVAVRRAAPLHVRRLRRRLRSGDADPMLRALIVDDERLSREKIRTFLSTRDDVTIVGEAANVKQAMTAITSERPDLVFLDIQMPGGDGFDIARALPETTAVVFVTAHDEYALRAFDIAAVDYLLKPFDRRRFDQAVERAKKSGGRPKEAASAFFTVRKRDKVLLVAVRDVDWIDAEGKYVRIHARGQSHLIRDGIAAVEARLDKRQFVRIHRSTIVNLRRIAEMQRGDGGDYIVVLHDGTRLTLSRRFRPHVREMTGLDL